LRSALFVTIAELLGGTPIVAATPPPNSPTNLDTYVAAPDASYTSAFKSPAVTNSQYTAYNLSMTSQTWWNPTIVNPSVWTHWLQIVVPTTVKTTTAVLIIGENNNSTNPPALDSRATSAAIALGAVAVYLPSVPNQPTTFLADGMSRTEDQIVAYTFNQLLNGTGTPSDQNWPLLLPMVKSVVRAMDTAQAYARTHTTPTVNIDKFIVSGGSKRGWTTWLTPAVDNRIRAIVPLVFDALNVGFQFPHHKDTYFGICENITTNDLFGGYSTAVIDYTNFHVFDRLRTPQGQLLGSIVDPYQYLGRPAYNIPKYLINSTGDEFFVPDSAQFYIGDVPGQNYLRYLPNTEHEDYLNTDAQTAVINFEKAVIDAAPLPRFTWTVTGGGTTIRLTPTDPPASVSMWQATNPNSRDLRLETFGQQPQNKWTNTLLNVQADGTYVAQVGLPASGITAFMIEMVYNVDGMQLTFTTQISSVPQFVPAITVVDAGGTFNGNPFPATATATGAAGGPVAGSFTYYYANQNTPGSAGSTTAPSAPGTYTVTADMQSGDPSYTNATSLPVSFTIGPQATTTTFTTSSSPSVPMAALILAAAVHSSGTSVVPTGNVTFKDGDTILATAPLVNGQAQFNALPVSTTVNQTVVGPTRWTFGTHSLTATYSGDSNFAASTSAALMQSIQPVTVVPNPQQPGKNIITVSGTYADDTITITAGIQAGQIQVDIQETSPGQYHFNSSYDATSLAGLYIYSGTTNNTIQIGDMNFPTIMIGAAAAGSNTFTLTAGLGHPTIVMGGPGTNTLRGPNVNSVWNINGPNSGGTQCISFAYIQNLIGGTGIDRFQFAEGGSLSGRIDGGSGNPNWLDYALCTSGVSVNLANGTASHAGSIANIQHVRGGGGNDVLTGGSQAAILLGGPGNDTITGGVLGSILVGGPGTDQLTGQSGMDILIGGTTDYDNGQSLVPFLQLMNAWSAGSDLATRIAALKSGQNLNGVSLNMGTTVHDDGAANTLTGGGNVNWFLKGANDTITDLQSGDIVN
jgi:PhoPQ-activated pathogenicity-related protein